MPVFQTREQILQERVRNIDNLEKKYDKLVTQKRKVRCYTVEPEFFEFIREFLNVLKKKKRFQTNLFLALGPPICLLGSILKYINNYSKHYADTLFAVFSLLMLLQIENERQRLPNNQICHSQLVLFKNLYPNPSSFGSQTLAARSRYRL